MHARRRLYVEQWPHQRDDERYSVVIARGGKPVPGIDPDRITYVEEEVMYWRKANHIHAWFVDNVQKGIDDCGTYCIPPDALRRLLNACEDVIKASMLVDGQVYVGTTYNADHPEGIAERRPGKVIADATVAMRLLPTREGCFFGCYAYDEDYLDEVKRTKLWITRTLAQLEAGVPGDLYYHSSW